MRVDAKKLARLVVIARHHYYTNRRINNLCQISQQKYCTSRSIHSNN